MSYSPEIDSYFPPTPPTDEFKQATLENEMGDLQLNAPHNHLAKGASVPSKVTLSLGHMPPKKEIKATYPRTPSRVDPNNPPWPAYRGYHEYSFAHATMGVRLPTILGKGIDDTIKTLCEQWDEDKIVDLVACINRMEELMTDLSGNAKLRPIMDDGEGDVALWNKEIAKYFQGTALPRVHHPWF
jgi:hypothetical protein